MAIHIIPINDLKEHEELTTCECCPSVKFENGEMIIVHNSFDGRELNEQEKKMKAVIKQNGETRICNIELGQRVKHP